MVFQGRPFFGEDIQKLGRMSEAGDWEDGIGEVTAADIMDQYVDRLLEGYDGGAFRIAWDTGNGAAGPAGEKLTAKWPGEHVDRTSVVRGKGVQLSVDLGGGRV